MGDPSAKLPADSDSVANLRLQLQDRDRRLAELTEHTLRILDDLAAQRQQAGDRQALQEQNAKLQELLADTRARVRQAANVVVGTAAASGPFEVVSWGVAGLEGRRVQRQVEACGDVAVCVLAGAEAAELAGQLPVRAGLAVLDTPCPTLATAINLGMASTQAAVVVFLWGGARLPAEGLARLAGVAAAEGVAAAAAVVQAGKQRWLGQSADEHLIGEDLGLPRGRAAVTEVPFPMPEAFAIARATFAATGALDQDLRSEVALTEWTLRARQRGLRVVGVRDAVAEVPATLRAGSMATDPDGQVHDSDRMIALARHRPGLLGAAMVACPSFWAMPPEQLGERFGALLRRLPAADGHGIAVELLVQQVTGVAQQAVPAPVLQQHLAQLERILDVTLDVGSSHYPDALRRMVEQVHVSVRNNRDQVRGTLERLQREVEAEREAKAHLQQLVGDQQVRIQELGRQVTEQHAEIGRCQAAIREQKDELLARDGALSRLKDEIVAREGALSGLKDEILAREGALSGLKDAVLAQQGAAAQLRDELRAGEQRLAELQRSAAVQAVELKACLQTRDELLRERDDLRQHARNLEDAATHQRAQVASLQVAVSEHERVQAELRERLAAAERRGEEVDGRRRETDRRLYEDLATARARVAELEQQLAAESGRLEAMIGDLSRYRTDLEDTRTDRERLSAQQLDLREQCKQLDARMRDTRNLLAEREQWIASLLEEVGKRRFVPRALLEHERKFLADRRRS